MVRESTISILMNSIAIWADYSIEKMDTCIVFWKLAPEWGWAWLIGSVGNRVDVAIRGDILGVIPVSPREDGWGIEGETGCTAKIRPWLTDVRRMGTAPIDAPYNEGKKVSLHHPSMIRPVGGLGTQCLRT